MLKNLFSFIANNETDPKPSTEVIGGKINYKFLCGLEAYQEELNLDQTERLTTLLLQIDFANVIENTLQEFIQMLSSGKVIQKVLDIILIGNTENDYTQLKNSELQKVFSDFFSLNPTAVGWLKNIAQGLISIPPTQST